MKAKSIKENSIEEMETAMQQSVYNSYSISGRRKNPSLQTIIYQKTNRN